MSVHRTSKVNGRLKRRSLIERAGEYLESYDFEDEKRHDTLIDLSTDPISEDRPYWKIHYDELVMILRTSVKYMKWKESSIHLMPSFPPILYLILTHYHWKCL